MSHNSQTSKKRKAAGGNQTANQSNQTNDTSISSQAQRQRLIDALSKRSMTTLQIRRELDILGVAPRIFELKRAGNKITTHWCTEATDCGQLHRVARYVLERRAQ